MKLASRRRIPLLMTLHSILTSAVFSLKRFFELTGNGISATIPVSVRGCVPIQYGNPYDKWGCWNIQSYNTNPYIMAMLKTLYWPDLNVGAVPGSPTGEYCQCGSTKCNDGPLVRPSTIAVWLIAVAVGGLTTSVHLLR